MSDFFAHQDAARRRTRHLVVLFILAVVAIIVAVYLAAALFLFGSMAAEGEAGSGLMSLGLFGGVATATLMVIGGGSLYKTVQLAEGGPAVARLLGGRPLDRSTTRADERRVLNVVEEMAIASGTPVPEVYLLADERGINAFAAGRQPGDAVIGITQGAIRMLDREELQGVVAHEFSHILNGDMRLNLRLIGLVHGILVISMLGYFMMRAGGGSSRSSRKGGAAGLALFGVAVYAIGWIGVFFGRLIKAAVSRQRELLADASAVQFTRNPGGLAGALKKIGGSADGSRVRDPHAEQASHLFFGNGLKPSWFALTATHPPLEERIRRLDPSFDGVFPTVEWPPAEVAAPAESPPAGRARIPIPLPGFPGALGPAVLAGGAAAAAAPGPPVAAASPPAAAPQRSLELAPERVSESVGDTDPPHLAYAEGLLAALPPRALAASTHPLTAKALAYGLLLDRDEEVRRNQREALSAAESKLLTDELELLLPALAELPAEARLPLVDLALPALRRLSPEQYRTFRGAVRALVRADGRLNLFEYALQHLLVRHLDAHFGPVVAREARPARGSRALPRLGAEAAQVLSTLAHAGQRSPEPAAEAFAAGVAELGGVAGSLRLLGRSACTLGALDAALDGLAAASPRDRERVLRAAVAAVGHDRRVTRREAELLRAVADALDCPVPPFLRASAA